MEFMSKTEYSIRKNDTHDGVKIRKRHKQSKYDFHDNNGYETPKDYEGSGRKQEYKRVQRYLETCVGRNWDDVYSEYLSKNTKDHHRELIKNCIELGDRIQIIDGVAYYKFLSWGKKRIEFHGLFVNPETKIISFQKRNKKYRREKFKPKLKIHKIKKTDEFVVSYQNRTYLCKYVRVPKMEKTEKIVIGKRTFFLPRDREKYFDSLLQTYIDYYNAKLYYGEPIRVVQYRNIKKKEYKSHVN